MVRNRTLTLELQRGPLSVTRNFGFTPLKREPETGAVWSVAATVNTTALRHQYWVPHEQLRLCFCQSEHANLRTELLYIAEFLSVKVCGAYNLPLWPRSKWHSLTRQHRKLHNQLAYQAARPGCESAPASLASGVDVADDNRVEPPLPPEWLAGVLPLLPRPAWVTSKQTWTPWSVCSGQQQPWSGSEASRVAAIHWHLQPFRTQGPAVVALHCTQFNRMV